MPFFHYSQNNSGGSFDYDEAAGLTHHVVIEAEDADSADRRAEEIGIYFGGCEDGRDCSCCGDRWSRAWRDGDETPKVYNEPALTHPSGWLKREAVVHFADGRVEWSPERETQ